MITGLAIVLSFLLGAGVGFLLTLRSVPRILARMSATQMDQLAERVADRKGL